MTRPYTDTIPAFLLDKGKKKMFLGVAAKYLAHFDNNKDSMNYQITAEDVVQESLCRLIYALSPEGVREREESRMKSKRPLSVDFYAKKHTEDEWLAWFYAHLFNVASEKCRENQRLVSDPGDEGSVLDLVASVADDIGSICARELASDIDACVQGLPAKERDVFERRFYENEKYEEISARSKTPIGTLGDRFAAARKAVLKCLRSKGYKSAE